jgi:hypothetical protein
MEAIEGKVVKSDEDDDILDLDAWLEEVAEDEERPAPFTFIVGGVVYNLASADEFDWQETARLAKSNDTSAFVALLMGDEQYEKFCTNKLPNKAIEKIVKDWEAHYEVSVPESRASRRKSQRTAGPSKPTSRRRTRG